MSLRLQLILLVSLPAIASVTVAEHGSPWITAENDKGRMAQNDGIMLRSSNGVSWPLGHLVQRTKGARAYLRSEDENPIPVRVREAFDDMEGAQPSASGGYPRPRFEPDMGYGESMVLLAPKRPLTPGVTYALVLRYPETIQHDTYDEWTVASWTVTGEKDTTPPRWTDAPYVVFERAGDNYSTPLFDLPTLVAPVVSKSEPVYLRVRLTPVGGGKRLRLLIPLLPHQIETAPGCTYGHMTLWNAGPHDGTYYRVEMEALDLAGNAAPAPGAPLLIEWRTEEGISIRTVCGDEVTHHVIPAPEKSSRGFPAIGEVWIS